MPPFREIKNPTYGPVLLELSYFTLMTKKESQNNPHLNIPKINYRIQFSFYEEILSQKTNKIYLFISFALILMRFVADGCYAVHQVLNLASTEKTMKA